MAVDVKKSNIYSCCYFRTFLTFNHVKFAQPFLLRVTWVFSLSDFDLTKFDVVTKTSTLGMINVCKLWARARVSDPELLTFGNIYSQ